MKNKKKTFDQEELEILDAIDRDALVPAPLTKRDREAIRLAAKNTLAKTRSINIRLSERDLLHLKARAAEEGIPYQTLITSILHKYSRGT
jgi:predicted DNA binding CopG/RHH family protein